LVDDEPDLIDAYTRLLARSGLHCITATNSMQAQAAIRDEMPDLVITDLSLADGTGLDIVAAASRQSPRIPVIVMTGHGTPDLARRAIDAGARSYLIKPVSIAELRRAIDEALHLEADSGNV